MPTSISIHDGAKAEALLNDRAFLAGWQQLFVECPWATPFQGVPFVATWYATYAERYSPVLVVERSNTDDRLFGLLALARSRDTTTTELVVAGAHHAEYQVWLATAQNGPEFIVRALEVLEHRCGRQTMTFKYLPANAPTQTLRQSRRFGQRYRIESRSRPLVTIDRESLEVSLRKKHTRSRLNQLRRLGDLRLERIVETTALEPMLEDIIGQYDLRQGAKNACSPFRDDLLKKGFHLALLEQPGLLDVAVLKVGDKIASALIGIRGSTTLHLCIITHSPFFADQSPGGLLLLLLGSSLAESGIETLDLTPGGDPWKERFANAHDEVCVLTVYPRARALAYDGVRERSLKGLRRMLLSVGIAPQQARNVVEMAKRARFNSVAKRALSAVGHYREMRIYRLPISTAEPAEVGGLMKVDHLGDLLCFEPSERWHDKQRFLAEALTRLERGEHLYSYVEAGRLVHYGWLIERQTKSFVTEVQQEYDYPDCSSVLYDFYTHPDCRGRGLYQRCVNQMTRDAAAVPGTRFVYISALSDNGPSRHVIEKLGFQHVSTLSSRKVLNWRKTSVLAIEQSCASLNEHSSI